MANKILLIISLFTIQLSYSQNKSFNNKGSGQQNNNTGTGSQKIYNKTTVTINKKVAQEIHYNNPNGTQLYVTNLTLKDVDSTIERYCITFENPDSLSVNNIDLTVKFNNGFDTAYCEIPGFTDRSFLPFNKNSPIRNRLTKISTDKTEFNFKASYLAPNTKLKVFIVTKSKKGNSILIKGAGKLW